MNYKEKIEEIKKEFWSRVLEVSPADIASETISIVSDNDVDWLIEQAQRDAVTEYRIAYEKGMVDIVENTVAKDRVAEIKKEAVGGFVEYLFDVGDYILEEPKSIMLKNADKYLNQTKEDIKGKQ